MEKNSEIEALHHIQNRLAEAGHASRLIGGTIFVDLPEPRTCLGVCVAATPRLEFVGHLHAPPQMSKFIYRARSIDHLVEQSLAFLLAAQLIAREVLATEPLARAI